MRPAARPSFFRVRWAYTSAVVEKSACPRIRETTPSSSPCSSWSVTAHGPLPGRGKAPQTVTGTGADEVATLRDLDARLRGVPKPDGGRLEEPNRRLRQAYVAGAEEQSQRAEGRELTAAELERILGHYPGDAERGKR
jgi:hypothetical protein